MRHPSGPIFSLHLFMQQGKLNMHEQGGKSEEEEEDGIYLELCVGVLEEKGEIMTEKFGRGTI